MPDQADPLSTEATVAELASVADPLQRARLAAAVNHYLATLMRAVFDLRDEALVEGRTQGTITEVAGEVGLSRSRVHQITRPREATP